MAFNPNEHLIQIKNKGGAADYLPVQWRLVWFREACPNGTIETEIVHLDLDKETEEEVFVWNNERRRSEKVVKTACGVAIVRATVKDGKGGVATGTKMERASAFQDYLEKAETGAVGRALAALGYGTQFSPELDEAHRIVDAPVDRGVSAESGSDNGYSNGNGNGHRSISTLRPVTNSNSNGAVKANGNGNNSVRAATTAAIDVDPSTLATEQQIASIRKLCEHLGKAEPEKLEAISYTSAKELIAQLSQEYRQSRKAS